MFFQDLITGRKIGSAKEVEGLYYFEHNPSVSCHAHTAVDHSAISRKEQIILLHRRLGHPSFLYLKYLFPSLFQNK